MIEINEEVVSNFIDSFDKLYIEFMGYGGIVFDAPNEREKVIKNYYACALCHNMNWDYLCKRVIPDLYIATKGFKAELVDEITEEKLASYFQDYPKKHKIEADRRLRMLKELAAYTAENNYRIFDDILKCNSVSGENGLFNLVNTSPVFRDDPLHKKGNLFIQIILREGLVTVDDEFNTPPSIDYHVIRFFLRNGFMRLDEKYAERLRKRDQFSLDEVTELRTAISDCMKYICIRGSISISKVGFIAWSIARDTCTEDAIACENGASCPMKEICVGLYDVSYRHLREPYCNVGFY